MTDEPIKRESQKRKHTTYTDLDLNETNLEVSRGAKTLGDKDQRWQERNEREWGVLQGRVLVEVSESEREAISQSKGKRWSERKTTRLGDRQ